MGTRVTAEARRTQIVKGPTVREQIAAGPRFVTVEHGTCLACDGEPGSLDLDTGLCRPCWRLWRWSPMAEHQVEKVVPA